MSNFTYCAIVWHFCGIMNNSKIEKIQERALRIVFSDYSSDYQDLINRFGTDTMLQSRLKKIVLETFKSIKGINPQYIQNILKYKEQPYSLRNPTPLIQIKKKTTKYGLRSYEYLSSKLWNTLPNHMKNIEDIDIDLFKLSLKNWSGPNPNSYENPYL